MYVVVGNYGNDTIALLSWLSSQELAMPVTVLSVDTGWAAAGWAARVRQARTWAETKNFKTVHLSPKLQFRELIHDKADFPTQKFQWCAGILKGLPILDWLDEHDFECEATIVLATRAAQAKSLRNLKERIDESEHYGERSLWHPLVSLSLAERNDLIAATPLPLLSHRSLECDPCVNSTLADIQRLADADVKKTHELEVDLGQSMFHFTQSNCSNCQALKTWAIAQPQESESGEMYEMGCGAPYACGT